MLWTLGSCTTQLGSMDVPATAPEMKGIPVPAAPEVILEGAAEAPEMTNFNERGKVSGTHLWMAEVRPPDRVQL